MSYYIGVPLVFLLALMEASVFPMFRVAGFQPNAVMVLLTVWLMVRGPSEAFVLIPLGGLFLGLVDGAPLGTALLALAPLAFLQEARGTQLRETSFILTGVFTVLMSLAFQLIYLFVFTVMGENGSWLTAMTRIVIPTTLLNAVLFIPIYFIVSLSSGEVRRASYVRYT